MAENAVDLSEFYKLVIVGKDAYIRAFGTVPTAIFMNAAMIEELRRQSLVYFGELAPLDKSAVYDDYICGLRVIEAGGLKNHEYTIGCVKTAD